MIYHIETVNEFEELTKDDKLYIFNRWFNSNLWL